MSSSFINRTLGTWLKSSNLLNGGAKVADVYQPARDMFLDWAFGSDDTLETLTVNTWNNGLWVEIGAMNPHLRSLQIINGNASPNFHYRLLLSRNGLDADSSLTVASTASTSQYTRVDISQPTIGHDLYLRLDLNPDTGDSGTQLTFQAYVAGRGG